MKTSFRQRLGKEILLFDGASGTMLQKAGLPVGARPEVWSLTHPKTVTDLHLQYLNAGADIIKTNTFGANVIHYPDGSEYSVEEIVSASIDCAEKAVMASGKDAYIALDIGPLGKLVGYGRELDFEEAVGIFARTVRAGASRADLVLLETFGDIAEVRAALLAVKENCELPVVVTNVYSLDGRTFSGSSPEVLCRVLEGMGADSVGMNCSLGPVQMESILPHVLSSTTLPVTVNPNAGLPKITDDGRAEYDITADEYVDSMLRMAKAGASLLGGCCGTTPQFIEKLYKATRGLEITKRECYPKRVVCSATACCIFEDSKFVVIGERINPTGKSKLKAALREGDIDYLIGEGHRQAACGADILDVNTGLPEIDEVAMLTLTVERLQNVTSLPLQIDTSDPVAMESALRRYNGRALINSVNGGKASMDAILPLAAKYGGVVVALTLDESGIPETPDGRLEIAERILLEAQRYGLDKEDIIVDPLTLTLGADPDAAKKTLAAVSTIKEKLGLATSLGVSNISFGLPNRESINRDFLLAAKSAGLDAAILNPCSEPMMSAARCDTDGADITDEQITAHLNQSTNTQVSDKDLRGCICGGMSGKAVEFAKEYLLTRTATEIIDKDIIPSLEIVGEEYENGKIFLPGLLASAEAAIAALSVLTEKIAAEGGEGKEKGRVVLATVEGDIHDIGKNIVGVLLKSYGFTVIDLGRNVPPTKVVEAVRESGAKVVGLSALMTTTLPSMRKTIEFLRADNPLTAIVVGGAVLTEEYALTMNADKYAPAALDTVKFVSEIYGV